ncbi:hypothetical protein QCD60_29475 [Pokkaliibacter sp. MBI-7]|uniref:hypothetical protein n=1 Tax=Pokkaliibacter sp. MBI-7 TaxID=3040600 RepID=UPI002448DC89|nr:hypothetical protein [Pokkaliibacter sp. MBI-7]MDH2436648.1 hypothetical protein [Pokkaliibacter sp. MBI-7]
MDATVLSLFQFAAMLMQRRAAQFPIYKFTHSAMFWPECPWAEPGECAVDWRLFGGLSPTEVAALSSTERQCVMDLSLSPVWQQCVTTLFAEMDVWLSSEVAAA